MQMKLVTLLLKLGINKCSYVTGFLLRTIGAEVVVFVNTRMLLTGKLFVYFERIFKKCYFDFARGL